MPMKCPFCGEEMTPGVIQSRDMTTEAAVAKLMWIMGQTREFSEVERLFYQPVAQDILRFGDE